MKDLFVPGTADETAFLEGLKAFLRIPSVSTDPTHEGDVARAAAYLADHMRAVGLEEVAVHPTEGHPVVTGHWHVSKEARTVLIYGHYDVQPEDPLELWTTEPFEPVIRDGKLYARGASDDKGQVWMHLAAIVLLKRAGIRPKVNLTFLFEGEEEIGSPYLPAFLQANRSLLATDVVVISDTPMFGPGVPTICYGVRGMTGLEVTLTGPERDMHSGSFGGGIHNPLHAMADLIASLHDDEGRVTVEGFYDEVRPVPDRERAAWAELPFDEAAWLSATGAPALFGEAGCTTLERISARPTLEVNGMWGGFTGSGGKTIIPSAAHAKITCRLVPDQDPEQIAQRVRHHLETHCPSTVRIQVVWSEHGAPAVVAPLTHPAVRAAEEALEASFGRAAVHMRTGGSIPIVASFKSELGADSLLLGFALDSDRAHSPNEHWRLEEFRQGLRTLIAFWQLMGA